MSDYGEEMRQTKKRQQKIWGIVFLIIMLLAAVAAVVWYTWQCKNESVCFASGPTAPGYAWSAHTVSAAYPDWYAMASSADGMKLVAATGQYNINGFIYTSIDGGNNWTKRTSAGSEKWTSLASSADGMKLVAAGYGSDAYTSIDGGATWTDQTASGVRNWNSVASSADGTRLVAAEGGGKQGVPSCDPATAYTTGDIYTSDDGGATWTDQAAAGKRYWSSVASSADGRKIAAGVSCWLSTPGSIYTSDDFGNTWSAQSGAGTRMWGSIASSEDGTKLAATLLSGSSQVYTSQDSGITWASHTAGSGTWGPVLSSSDGTRLLAVAYASNVIRVSVDSGATWAIDTRAGTRSWSPYAAAMSADGLRVVVGVNGGTRPIMTAIWNTAPNFPDLLRPESLTNGSTANSAQPTFLFHLADTDADDAVAFEIKIATDAGFTSPVVDYTSGLNPSGDASFTVGEGAGDGAYTAGSGGQKLADGSYYWEVQAIDSHGFTSLFSGASASDPAFRIDATPPVISESVPVPHAVGIATPAYTFASSETGTITYGGDCSSATTAAVSGSNTITFNTLADGTHGNCTIIVTDSIGNASAPLHVSSFIVDTDDPILTQVAAVPSPIANHTPSYIFSLNEPATISYGGDCMSADTTAVSGSNRITFSSLPDGTYANCTLQATDALGNLSNILLVPPFVVDTVAAALSETIPVPSPTKLSRPAYTFTVSEAGTASYEGDCSSQETALSAGANTITFSSLSDGLHENCTITVTDAAGSASAPLQVTAFVVDTHAPIVSEVRAVATPASAESPTYAFLSNEAGTIAYAGPCTSIATGAIAGINEIIFEPLPEGSYDSCSIVVTDAASNRSDALHITAFVIDEAPVVAQVMAVSTPTKNRTPAYSFSSTKAGSIEYSGGCRSATEQAIVGVNMITLSSLPAGSYDSCSIRVTDAAGMQSSTLQISPFVIRIPSSRYRISVQSEGELAPTTPSTVPAFEQNIVAPQPEPQPELPVPAENEEAHVSKENSAPRFTFTRIFGIGERGSDVAELQKYLNDHNYFVAKKGPGSPGNETTYFGVLTRNALVIFQEIYFQDILVPLGLLQGTGFFGENTMRFINSHP